MISTGQHVHVIAGAAIPGRNAKLVPQKNLGTVLVFDSTLSDPFDKHSAFQVISHLSVRLKWD